MLRVLDRNGFWEDLEADQYVPEELWPLVSGRPDLHNLDHMGGSSQVRECGGRK